MLRWTGGAANRACNQASNAESAARRKTAPGHVVANPVPLEGAAARATTHRHQHPHLSHRKQKRATVAAAAASESCDAHATKHGGPTTGGGYHHRNPHRRISKRERQQLQHKSESRDMQRLARNASSSHSTGAAAESRVLVPAPPPRFPIIASIQSIHPLQPNFPSTTTARSAPTATAGAIVSVGDRQHAQIHRRHQHNLSHDTNIASDDNHQNHIFIAADAARSAPIVIRGQNQNHQTTTTTTRQRQRRDEHMSFLDFSNHHQPDEQQQSPFTFLFDHCQDDGAAKNRK